MEKDVEPQSPDTEQQPLLPPELFSFAPFVPLAIAVAVAEDHRWTSSAEAALRLLGDVALITTSVTVWLLLAYKGLVPRLFRRVRRAPWRGAVHVLVVLGGGMAIPSAYHATHVRILGEHAVPLVPFALRVMSITASVAFPALAVQANRVRRTAAEIAAKEAERLAIESQLRALQSHVNPHFMFNALNTVPPCVRGVVRSADPAEGIRRRDRAGGARTTT